MKVKKNRPLEGSLKIMNNLKLSNVDTMINHPVAEAILVSSITAKSYANFSANMVNAMIRTHA